MAAMANVCLGQAGVHHPFQALDASLLPPVEVGRRQPADVDVHLGRTGVAVLGDGGCGGLYDALRDSGSTHSCFQLACRHFSRPAVWYPTNMALDAMHRRNGEQRIGPGAPAHTRTTFTVIHVGVFNRRSA